MKRFAAFVALYAFSSLALSSGLDRTTAQAIQQICLSPGQAQSHTELSGAVHALPRVPVLTGGKLRHSESAGPPSVPNSQRLQDRADYRKCALEALKINETTAIRHSPRPVKRAVTVINVLGEGRIRKQHREHLELRLGGRIYDIDVDESHNRTVTLIEGLAGRSDYAYSIEGFSSESYKTSGIPVEKRIFCQGHIYLSGGDILEFKRRGETPGSAEVCLSKVI